MSARLEGADDEGNEAGDSDSMAFEINQLFLSRVSGFLGFEGGVDEDLREGVDEISGRVLVRE